MPTKSCHRARLPHFALRSLVNSGKGVESPLPEDVDEEYDRTKKRELNNMEEIRQRPVRGWYPNKMTASELEFMQRVLQGQIKLRLGTEEVARPVEAPDAEPVVREDDDDDLGELGEPQCDREGGDCESCQ
jgi:hypothetical protein